jgi:hypothetical protein
VVTTLPVSQSITALLMAVHLLHRSLVHLMMTNGLGLFKPYRMGALIVFVVRFKYPHHTPSQNFQIFSK